MTSTSKFKSSNQRSKPSASFNECSFCLETPRKLVFQPKKNIVCVCVCVGNFNLNTKKTTFLIPLSGGELRGVPDFCSTKVGFLHSPNPRESCQRFAVAQALKAAPCERTAPKSPRPSNCTNNALVAVESHASDSAQSHQVQVGGYLITPQK